MTVGRAEDCRVTVVILRSLVRIRLEGKLSFFVPLRNRNCAFVNLHSDADRKKLQESA